MPKTNKDVIIEYTNLIEKKLELFAEEPYRVWTDSAENRAKEARYSKWYEFHYGEASEQPDPSPRRCGWHTLLPYVHCCDAHEGSNP